MKNKRILIIFTTLVIIFILLFCVFQRDTQVNREVVQSNTQNDVTSNNNWLQDYYSLYSDPFVIQIRTTLDSYLKDPKTLNETVLEGLGDKKSGLNNFSSDYYKGRFIVIDISNSIAGGKEINILFPDKPDKVFWVWVYRIADGTYEFRGFKENSYYNTEKIDYYKNNYPQLFIDTLHSL
jgi:hypothetical protein